MTTNKIIKGKCEHNVYIQNCALCNTRKDKQILHRNPENFDDGLTQVAPSGEFKAMNERVIKLILEIKKKWEMSGSGINYWWVKWIEKAFEEGRKEALTEKGLIKIEDVNKIIDDLWGFKKEDRSKVIYITKFREELKQQLQELNNGNAGSL